MKQDAFLPPTIDLIVPDVGAKGGPIRLVTWLVPPRSNVIPGERVAELLTQGTVLQLEANAEGVLAEQCVPAGATVCPDQVIGRILLSETTE